MAVFMLTTENILKVEVIIHPGSSESATFRRSVQHSLGNSLAEQMLYLNDAVDAAKDCFSRRLTRDLNADLTFNFKSYFGSKLGELSAQSSSSGLAYGIAAVRSWLTILHQQMLFQSVRFPEVDLFVTGELTKDGQINRIGGLQKKIELLMQYQDQLSSDTRSPFYVLTPQANVDEYMDEQSQQQWVSNQQWIKDRGGVLLSFSSLPEFLEHICDGYLASEHFGQSYELPGLRPFSFAHRNMYFGRSSEIEVFSRDALEAFQEKKMFTVHGFSGAGKSSFLMAGVIPAILSKAEGRFRTFLPEIHILRPRDFPSAETLKQNILCQVFNLESWQAENGLNQMLPLSGQPDQIQAIYENYIQHLSDDEIQALNKPLLLLIDQAEELYTIPTFQNEAASFCKWLAALSHYLPVNFLLSIRTEYQAQLNLQEISSYRELPVLSERAREEILESLSDLLRMNWSSDRTDYKETVKERFLRDARTAPLPAVGYALQLMRDRSSLYPKDYKSHISGSLFTHEIYNQIGRIEGVISSQAELAVNSVTNILFNHLKPDAQEEARDRLLHDLFCAFIGVSQDGQPVAQVVSKKTLNDYRDSAVLERLVLELMSYGLIVSAGTSVNGGLKLAHDALLPNNNSTNSGVWGSLENWYAKSAEQLSFFRDIYSDYYRWKASEKKDFFLKQVSDIDIGLKLNDRDLIGEKLIIEYLQTSDKKIKENELAHQTKLSEAERKITKRTRIGLWVSSSLVIVCLLAFFLTYHQSILLETEAENSRKLAIHATSLRLISQATHSIAVTKNDLERSVQRTILASHLDSSREVVRGLYEVTGALSSIDWLRSPEHSQGPIHLSVISPDEKFVVQVADDGLKLIVLSAVTGEIISRLDQMHEDFITTLSFDTKTGLLYSGGLDGLIFEWSLSDGTVKKVWQGENRISKIKTHPYQSNLAILESYYSSGYLIMLNLEDDTFSKTIDRVEMYTDLSFDDLDENIVIGDWYRGLSFFSSQTGEFVKRVEVLDAWSDKIFYDFARIDYVINIPSSRNLLIGRSDGRILVWDSKRNQMVGQTYDWHISSGIRSMDLSSDGKWCASIGNDGKVIVWSIDQAQIKREITLKEPWHISFSKSADFAVITLRDGSIIRLDLSSEQEEEMYLENGWFSFGSDKELSIQESGEIIHASAGEVLTVKNKIFVKYANGFYWYDLDSDRNGYLGEMKADLWTVSQDGKYILSYSSENNDLAVWSLEVDTSNIDFYGIHSIGRYSVDLPKYLLSKSDFSIKSITVSEIKNTVTLMDKWLGSINFDFNKLINGKLVELEVEKPFDYYREPVTNQIMVVTRSADGVYSRKLGYVFEGGMNLIEDLNNQGGDLFKLAIINYGSNEVFIAKITHDAEFLIGPLERPEPINYSDMGPPQVTFSFDGKYLLGLDPEIDQIIVWDADTGERVNPNWLKTADFVERYLEIPVKDSLKNIVLRVFPGPTNLESVLCNKLTKNMSPSDWSKEVGELLGYFPTCPGLAIAK